MKKYLMINSPFKILCISLLFILSNSLAFSQNTIVEKYGQLRISGNRMVDKNGNAVQLRGMSLYWSQWQGGFYNYNAIKWLRDDWKVTVVRAALAINGTSDGYLVNPSVEKAKVFAVIDAAISLGIYVIVDWHDHNAHNSRSQAQAFFNEVATKYGNTPNVLYEIWNEPLNYSWNDIIKPYHQALVTTIRAKDPDNIIICGTRNWSQQVGEAADNPVSGSNIAYTLHYYANTHGQWLRDLTTTALNKGIAIFVTEYGTTDATGKGTVNATATKDWWTYLDNNKIGHCNWSISAIPESSSALVEGASVNGNWSTSQLKTSGALVRTELRAKAIALGTCTATAIVPYMQINGGAWQNVSTASARSDQTIKLGPQPASGGAWSWTGCGLSGTAREQTFTRTSSCTATATYTNSCGAKSTRAFTVNIVAAREGAEVLEEENPIISPNPSNDFFTINQAGKFNYQVSDLAGKTFLNGNGENRVEFGQNLNKGLYILSIQSESKKQVMKLIKN